MVRKPPAHLAPRAPCLPRWCPERGREAGDGPYRGLEGDGAEEARRRLVPRPWGSARAPVWGRGPGDSPPLTACGPQPVSPPPRFLQL